MRNGSAPSRGGGGGGAAHTREQTLPPLEKSCSAAPDLVHPWVRFNPHLLEYTVVQNASTEDHIYRMGWRKGMDFRCRIVYKGFFVSSSRNEKCSLNVLIDTQAIVSTFAKYLWRSEVWASVISFTDAFLTLSQDFPRFIVDCSHQRYLQLSEFQGQSTGDAGEDQAALQD